ncbi:MAG: 5-formyltetrahydrofolate cyclo-ligase [Deltaproteobacteria bacterium]|nr:5-formyltetrahydrofolate cyclo-ligase [Deltaproteobacteria bacterium]
MKNTPEPAGTGKQALRQQMKATLGGLEAAWRAEAHPRIMENLLGLPVLAELEGDHGDDTAPAVHLFISLPHEVDTAPLFPLFRKAGLLTGVPLQHGRSVPEQGLGVSLWNPGEPLARGPFGVAEPPPEAVRPLALERIALVIVPGLAFDRQGNRLGHGKGYYDEFLARLAGARQNAGKRAPWLVAPCYSAQLLAGLPSDPWDIRLDFIVTEKEALACTG